MNDTVKSENKPAKEGFLAKLRGIFFPIYGSEIKRFVPMALMMFFILYNYSILRNVKDALVINGRGAEGEIISFIKLWGTMPAAILFVVLFSKMANIMSRERIFYLCIGFFLAFFGSFAYFIYPNIDYLHPSAQTVHRLQEQFPNFKMFIAMWGNWTYCLFYVLAEMWGSTILSLFFWQLANEVTKSSEAKRFYPLFGVVGNVGLILAGRTTKFFSQMTTSLPTGTDPWQVSLYYLMGLILVSGVAVIGFYYYINSVTASAESAEGDEKKTKKKKPKLGITESFKYIFTSKHLMAIATMVLAYGITMNFIDVLWKGQVKLMSNGQNNAAAALFGTFSEITGYLSIILMFAGGAFLRRFGWLKSACVAPTVLGISSILFFAAVIYGNFIPAGEPMLVLFGYPLTTVFIAVQIGTWSGAFTKASKYSLFDSTKEMSYIPLDAELRSKGKAAVDVTGGRLGKSGGSLTIFTLSTLMPTLALTELAPFLAAISVVVIAGWFIAVGKLNKSLNELEGGEAASSKEDQPALKEQTAK
ncbi:MAG: Npt1/Npt2 family nucleotide transporter [Chlamydiota bacterium]|nr:Npt1/Npt2 family nucleotide transporter [Chlamydiota bacterium]